MSVCAVCLSLEISNILQSFSAEGHSIKKKLEAIEKVNNCANISNVLFLILALDFFF